VQNLREKILEFAEIARTLPDNLQAICFELLLKHYLQSLTPQAPPSKGTQEPEAAANRQPSEPKPVEESAKSQADLTLADLHLKARRFLEKHSLSIDQLNNLFYKEDDKILPLYEDLKTTRMAEGQIRVALLQTLHNALRAGDFEAQVEDIRKECADRKCYDGANFTANFKNNQSLFDFDKYTKQTKSLRLSDSGRKELAAVIKELQ
jgi:hypothetical protein